MSLLSATPTLQQICTAVLGHANAGDDLTTCFSSANAAYFDDAYKGNKDRQSNFGLYGLHEQPTINFNSASLTLSGTSYTITVGSAAVHIWWTASGMPTSPHTNYITMTKPGPVTVYTGSKGSVNNGVPTDLAYNMTENAAYNTTYNVYIEYDQS
jgi:hypothetical protein